MSETLTPASAQHRRRRRPRLAPLLVSAPEAARLLGDISVASFYRRLSAGQIGPEPLALGGRKLFRVADLKRFVRLGLPDRATWLELELARKHNGRA